jgi:hypothetical protein
MGLRRLVAFWLRGIYLAFCLMCPVFLTIALVFAVKTEIFLHRCTATSGIVTANVPIENTDASGTTTTFAPTFKFTASDGRIYGVTSGTSSNPPGFAVGQQVRVLYELNDPASAKIDSFGQLWGFSLGFGIGSVVCGAVGFWILLLRRRRIQRHAVTTA